MIKTTNDLLAELTKLEYKHEDEIYVRFPAYYNREYYDDCYIDSAERDEDGNIRLTIRGAKETIMGQTDKTIRAVIGTTLDEAIMKYESKDKQVAVWLKELKMQRDFANFMIDKCTTLERKLQEQIRETSKSA